LWALLDGAAHRDWSDAAGAGSSPHARAVAGKGAANNPAQVPAAGPGGYISIILWPDPPRKEILAPVMHTVVPQDAHLTKPLIIRFSGAYWYFQPPEEGPGEHAYVAHGTPLATNIHSTTFVPLTMEANQNLAPPLQLACCRAISVDLENSDNQRGILAVAMRLTDSAAPGKPVLSLGEQLIASSEPDRFTVKIRPVRETLRFPIPARTMLRRFDQITLTMIGSPDRIDTGARIAIDQFELDPR
jgi:hypothetical protein